MTIKRAESDAVMSEIVRRRIEDLMAERGPRRAAPERREPEPDPPPASSPDRESGTPVAVERGGRVAGLAPGAAAAAARALEFGRAHLVVVAIIAIAGCLYAAWTMTQARTIPVAVAAPTAAAPEPAQPTPTASPMPSIRVHVIGAVRRPGVVQLPEGARVQDAVRAAGGLRKDARLGDLNLAAVVPDAAQVVVGSAAKPGSRIAGDAPGGTAAPGAAPAGAQSKLNLNTATAEQLDTLPGVGPVTAQNILAWRSQHQRFSRIEELQEVDGIGPKTFAQIAPHVRV